MLVTQGNIQSLHVAFSSIFYNALESASAEWEPIVTKVPSSTKRNEYGWLRNIPQLQKSVGSKVVDSFVRKAYQVQNERYESVVGVSVDDIEDDNIGSYRMAFESHAQEAGDWLGKAALTLLPRGLPGGEGLCFDGLTFFNAAHPKLDDTTYSNVDAGGGGAWWYLLDARKRVKPLIVQERKMMALTVKNMPTDDCVFDDDEVRWKISNRTGFGYAFPQMAYASNQPLTEANLENAMTAMMSQTGDDGRKLDIMPDTIVVGPTKYFAAKRLVAAVLNPNGGSNIFNGTLRIINSQFVESVSIDL